MLWLVVGLVSTGVIIYGLVKYYLLGNSGYWPSHGIPLVKSGEIASFWDRITVKYPFQDLDKMYYEVFRKRDPACKVGGIMELRKPVLFVLDLDIIRSITVKDFEHFVNRRPFPITDDESHMGKSLIFLESQKWKDMRSTLSPSFSTGKIRRMFEIFDASAKQMSDYLRSEVERTGSNDVELREVFGRQTMNVISSAAFGLESNALTDKDSIFYQMGQRIQNQFKGLKIIKFLVAVFIPQILKVIKIEFMDRQAMRFFGDVVTKAVKHRESSGEKRDDFIQLLLESRSEPAAEPVDEAGLDTYEKDSQLKNVKTSKVYLTDELILAQSILFFFAGFDTTETLLIYAAYELALNPEIQEKLALEINKAAELNDGNLSYDSVNTLEYLDMVVSETLRKYPPGIRLERRCTKDYKVPGHDYVVKKDDIVIIPTYPLHYDPVIYPDPQKFDPERFTQENKAKRSPYAYIPFGVGPRNCIAMRFALTEGKSAVAELVKSFVLEPTAKTTIPMEYSKTSPLKPAKGMWLKVTPRQ